MSHDGSVTRWLGQLRAGDPAAVEQLWQRYFRRLVGLARARLQGGPRGPADEEDVALSAFDSFVRAAEAGRFPQLADRDGLWRLLLTITARKAAHLLRDEGPRAAEELTLEEVLSREPDPALAAKVADQCQHLLHSLGDKDLQEVALERMEGYSVEEIAERLNCSARSVKRKLRLIRSLWQKEPDDD
jgi:DNA-directed RNA polymerase specialized sigma24 family protein